jgi:hypothetical protein
MGFGDWHCHFDIQHNEWLLVEALVKALSTCRLPCGIFAQCAVYVARISTAADMIRIGVNAADLRLILNTQKAVFLLLSVPLTVSTVNGAYFRLQRNNRNISVALQTAFTYEVKPTALLGYGHITLGRVPFNWLA